MIIGVAMLTSINAAAQVNWQFQIGGMYSKKYGMYSLDEKSGSGELSGTILLQIPVKQQFFIETGLGWRHKLVLCQAEDCKFDPDNYNYKDFDSDFADFLELPIKAGYKLQLNEKNAFDFGFGPYLSLAFNKPECFNNSSFSAGLNASVAFRHRCMSFGVSWQNPIFKNGLNDYHRNSVTVTIGINFKGRKPNWDKIMDGLSVAGAVLEGATQVASAFTGNSVTSYNANDYDSTDSNHSNTSGNKSIGKKYNIAEQQHCNSDKRVYEQYDSQLAMDEAGNRHMNDRDRKEVKRKMRALRLKWEAKGYSFPHSTREN